MLSSTVIISRALDVPNVLLGATVPAAGVCLPDLVRACTTARDVGAEEDLSKTVGKHVFNVSVCLPVPWLIRIAASSQPLFIGNAGIFPSVLTMAVLLFLFLIAMILLEGVIGKPLAKVMVFLYFVFQCIVISFLLSG